VNKLGVLIPIMIFAIPLVVVFFAGMQKMARLRIEEAKVRAGSAGGPEVEDLRNEVQQLRQELSEVQERLDFTERMLASQKDQAKLGRG
jgi:Tfp pilus assembly protein PilO